LRIVGLLLLFAMFGLPLHSHAVMETPRIAKECSCIHGTRIETLPAVVSTDWTPVTQASFLEIIQPQTRSHLVVTCYTIRAPPLF
jgi:hypothetical protein